MAPRASESSRQLRALTGLRGLAALLVVAHHAQFLFLPYDAARPVAAVGYVGVSFFFVLSGFVLVLGRTYEQPPGVFAWRRLSRIYPLYVLAVLAGAYLNAGRCNSLGWHLLALQSWMGTEVTGCYNSVTWSVSDELFFYAIFILLLPRLVDRLRRWIDRRPWLLAGPWLLMVLVATVVASVVSYSTSVDLLYLLPAYRSLEFLIGVLLAIRMQSGKPALVRSSGAWQLTVASYAGATIAHGVFKLHEGREAFFPQYWASAIVVPAFALLIESLAQREAAGLGAGWLGSSPWVRLGQWSYALYLVHHLLLHHAFDGWYALEDPWVRALGYPVFVVAAVAVSAGLHELVEAPAERWLRRRVPSRAPGGAPTS